MTIRNYNIEVGDMFGHWRVVRGPYMKKPHMSCDCVCACGATNTIRCSRLVDNESKSCGCVASRKTHGKSGTPVYSRYVDMHTRCYNPNHVMFKHYGGKGIRVCKRWHRFENFYADMGDPPIDMSLDRLDNSRNYSKSNCRWATRAQQNSNRTTNRFIRYRGRVLTLKQWSVYLKISYRTLQYRIARNWPTEQLLRVPTK